MSCLTPGYPTAGRRRRSSPSLRPSGNGLFQFRSWELPREAAAGRLGITRSRLNDLLQGKLAKFPLDALVNLATASGLTVHVQVAEAPDTTGSTPDRVSTLR